MCSGRRRRIVWEKVIIKNPSTERELSLHTHTHTCSHTDTAQHRARVRRLSGRKDFFYSLYIKYLVLFGFAFEFLRGNGWFRSVTFSRLMSVRRARARTTNKKRRDMCHVVSCMLYSCFCFDEMKWRGSRWSARRGKNERKMCFRSRFCFAFSLSSSSLLTMMATTWHPWNIHAPFVLCVCVARKICTISQLYECKKNSIWICLIRSHPVSQSIFFLPLEPFTLRAFLSVFLSHTGDYDKDDADDDAAI